jgi:hypothetical protein
MIGQIVLVILIGSLFSIAHYWKEASSKLATGKHKSRLYYSLAVFVAALSSIFFL